MLIRLLLVLLVIAVCEAALFVWLVTEAGFLPTIGIVLLAGFAGAALARWQGFRAWRAVRADLAAGRPPANAVVDGAMILAAGLLLVLPGLITDVLAILLLIPQVRAVLRAPLLAYFGRRLSRRFRGFAARASGQGEIIDAEFRRADLPSLDDRSGR